jgi:hypothetical protein
VLVDGEVGAARPQRSEPDPASLAAVLVRAAAGLLACPYCQSALQARQIDGTHLQLRCPTCGFREEPDSFAPEAAAHER